MIDRKSIRGILLQIAKDFPFSDTKMINSFANVDEPLDLALETFGLSYSDFINGDFWSRTWVNGGADPNKVKGEFPIQFMEHKQTIVPCLDEPDDETIIVHLGIADKFEPCDGCPPGTFRTKEQVIQDTYDMLKMAIKELLLYALYEVDIDGEQENMWLTEGRASAMQAAEQIDSYMFQGHQMTGILDLGKTTIDRWGWGAHVVGHVVTLKFHTCKNTVHQFEYSTVEVAKLATLRCNC